MNRVLVISLTTVLGCGGRTGLVADGDTGSGGTTEAGITSQAGTYCAWMGGPVASCEGASPTDPTMLCPTSYPFCRQQTRLCELPEADTACWGCCDNNGVCFFYPSQARPPVIPAEVCQ